MKIPALPEKGKVAMDVGAWMVSDTESQEARFM
jgi:hypothetical protein